MLPWLTAVQVAAMCFTSAAHLSIACRAAARARPVRDGGTPSVSGLLAVGAALWGAYARAIGNVPLLVTSATTFGVHACAIAGGALCARRRRRRARAPTMAALPADPCRIILSTDSESSLPQLPPPPDVP